MVKTGYILNRIYDQARSVDRTGSNTVYVKILTPDGIKNVYASDYDAEYIVQKFKKGDKIRFEYVVPELSTSVNKLDGLLRNVV